MRLHAVVAATCLMLLASGLRAQESSPPSDAPAPAVSRPDAADPEVSKPENGTDAQPYTETTVVTASRTKEQIIDAPVSISVVGPEQIEASPADNYADLLRGVPGLNVVQTSARDVNFTSRINTTTLSTSQLALVDGRSVYQDFFGFVMWDVLPVNFEEVESVEVLRGPGSAVWGPNAIAGVVNVRTKSPREIDGGLFVAGAGERGTRYGSILWADAFKKLSYKISGSWFQQDPWPRPTKTPSGTLLPSFANEGSQQPKADLRVDYEPEDGKLWSFRLGDARTSGIVHTGLGPFRVDDKTTAPYMETSYEGHHIDGKFYVNGIDGDAVNVLNGLDFKFKSTTYVGDLSWRHLVGKRNLFVLGGDARLSQFDLSLAPDESSRREAGAFLEDQIVFSDHVILSLGARVDDFSTIGAVFSPRTSLILKPNPNHSVRFAYNKAYRAPSLINNVLRTSIVQAATADFGGGPQTFYFPSGAVGNPDLKEETVDAYEIGYTANLRNKATLTAAVYQNVVKDNIDFYVSKVYTPSDPPPAIPGLPGLPDPPGPAVLAIVSLPKEFSFRNVGEARYRGVELGLNVDFAKGVTGQFSATWQDQPRVKDDTPLQPLDLGSPSKYLFHAGVQAHRGALSGGLGVSYTDNAFWSDVLDSRYWGSTPAFFQVDGSIGRDFAKKRLKLVLNATDLLDDRIQQHVFGDIMGRKATLELRAKW